MVCVFTAQSSRQTSNIYQCATLCASNDCRVFHHDDLTKTCSFYAIEETCQSQNNCKFVKAFFNNKYQDNFTDGHSSARYHILKGINFTFGSGNPNAFSVSNVSQIEPILLGDTNDVQIGMGRYNNSKLIIWIMEDLIIDMNKKKTSAELIGNNLVKYLTSGQCIWYYYCYHSIDDYNNYIGIPNLVFGIISASIFDFQDLFNKSITYNWHFILAKKFGTTVTSSIKSILNVYGYCASIYHGYQSYTISDNICKPTISPTYYLC